MSHGLTYGRTHQGAVLLKTAELEWSALQRQCPGQRLATQESVWQELLAWKAVPRTAFISNSVSTRWCSDSGPELAQVSHSQDTE